MNHDVEKLLAKAKRPLEIASKLHALYRGKIEVAPRCRVRDLRDFDVWYTLATHNDYDLASEQFLALQENDPTDMRYIRWLAQVNAWGHEYGESLQWY